MTIKPDMEFRNRITEHPWWQESKELSPISFSRELCVRREKVRSALQSLVTDGLLIDLGNDKFKRPVERHFIHKMRLANPVLEGDEL